VRIDTAIVPLATLLPFFGSTLVKSLVSGRVPDADDWASSTEKLLTALVAEQTHTSAERAQILADLARIEEKIDRMALASFEAAMHTGHALLRQAQRAWRRSDERDRLLQEARLQYTHAASSAPNPFTYTDAQAYLAATWLLLGSVEDTEATLAEAADALIRVAGGPRSTDWDFWNLVRTLGRNAWSIQDRLLKIQKTRQLLGVAPRDAPLPY
jgi:hypothetical protein